MRRVAAIDIGTNSVLLLVAEQAADGSGSVRPIVERATITRLGKGVDATRALDPEAVARTLACLADYGETLRAAGASRVDAVGTSAMRDARGGEQFIAQARELLGVAPRVISGADEARLTFSGALSGLTVAPGPVTVFDVGGGSTEVIVGEVRGQVHRIEHVISVDTGSVRLTERHVRSDPPLESELAEARADTHSALARARWGPPSTTLVGVAGTVTTLAAVALASEPYDASEVHGSRLSAGEVRRTVARLAALPLTERRKIAGLDPGRADVIVAGGLIVQEALSAAKGDAAAAELIVSDRGVRWGLVSELFRALSGAAG